PGLKQRRSNLNSWLNRFHRSGILSSECIFVRQQQTRAVVTDNPGEGHDYRTATCQVPRIGRAIGASRDDPMAVRSERGLHEAATVPQNGIKFDRLHGVGIPESCAAIQARRKNHQAVRAELSAHDDIAMFEIWEDFSTAFHFPHAGLVIVTSGHNLPVIRTKTSGVNPALMLQGRPNGFAVSCIPDLRGIIAARGYNQPAVVAEGGTEHRASVVFKLQFLLLAAEFPDASNVILAPGDDPRAIGTESDTENAIGMRQYQRSFSRVQVPETG